MKGFRRVIIAVTILLLAGAGSASAQDDDNRGGMGAFLDWIHKLSGPPLFGGGLTGFYGRPGEGFRFRLNVTIKFTYNESRAGAASDDISIRLISIEPLLEYGIPDVDFDVSAGPALDLYAAGAERISKLAFPIYAQFRPRNDSDFVPRVGAGVRLFPAFAADDFAQFPGLRVKRSGWEVVWQLFGGVEYISR